MTVKLESGGAQGMIVSSPSREEDLLHKQTTREFTTVLHWYTMCPSCRKMQRLNFWINMHKFESTDTENNTDGEPIPQCLCRYCFTPFDDSNNKREMNATGKYGREGLDGIEVEFFPEPELNRHVVFWWNSLNSPFRSFENIYKKYISVRFKPEDLKNFLISWLAEFQKNEISKSSITMLNERVNHNQAHGRVPEWTKIITAGIDTQDTGFYYVVEAHGILGQSSIIDYGFIESRKNNDSPKVVRKLIRDYFEVKTYYTRNKEKEWAIGLYAADAGGHRTKEWYEVAFSFAADDDENLEKLKLCLGRGKVDGLKETAKKGVYFVNTGIALDTTEDLYSSSHFSIYSGEHFNFFTQLTNYRKVKEIDKKTFAEKFYWKKNGQFDYRMAHAHAQIALGFRLNRKRIMDCLNDSSWEYNPIAHVKNKISEDSLKKESIYIEGNNDTYSFTDRGTIM
jgi:hypothetical protein